MKNRQKNIKATSTIGGRICKLRLKAGLSQEQLAEALYTTNYRISRLENDKQEPTCDELVQMCEILGVTTDYIIRGVNPVLENLGLTPEEKKLLRNLLEKLEIC